MRDTVVTGSVLARHYETGDVLIAQSVLRLLLFVKGKDLLLGVLCKNAACAQEHHRKKGNFFHL
jgi:hypothetical protein